MLNKMRARLQQSAVRTASFNRKCATRYLSAHSAQQPRKLYVRELTRCITLQRRTTAKSGIERSPCVLITAPESFNNTSLQTLALEVRQQLGFPAVIVAPKPIDFGNSSRVCTSAATACQSDDTIPLTGSSGSNFTFQQQLELVKSTDSDDTYFLVGATAADCVLCAVDHTHGLLQHLGFNPVLVLVGIASGPALSSDLDQHPAVAVARQAALLGLPAVAACLATTSAGAPVQPAVAAAAKLLRDVLALLTSSSSSSYYQQVPSNFPRAHFPFPEEGRWALGVQMPLPTKAAASAGSSNTHGHPGAATATAYDCWALGDDNSWLGNSSANQSAGRQQDDAVQTRHQQAGAKQQAYNALRRAYADGDVFLCLNVPPIWKEAAGFAATRPGVIWHCRQVLAQQQRQPHMQHINASNDVHQQQDPRTYSTTNDSSCVPSKQVSNLTRRDDGSSSTSSSHFRNSGGAASSATTGRWSHLYSDSSSSSNGVGSVESSWFVERQDLFGRTLPSSSYSSQIPMGSNFVGQDNTRKVMQGLQTFPETQTAFQRPSMSSGRQQQVPSPTQRNHQAGAVRSIPSSFIVQQGTLLSDSAASGDVEAVLSGRAAVTLCQTWPAGHPLSCRDELLLAALDEGAEGLPLWLRLEH